MNKEGYRITVSKGDAGVIPLRTEWQAKTDLGSVREVNEDRYFASDALGLWAIADGMGGMSRGDWAASQVIQALAALPREDDLDAMLRQAAAALEQANAAIRAESAARGEQMGTTAVLLVVRERDFGIVWIGDSRGYLLRHGKLHRLTRDHSQVRELVDRGLLDEASAARHPLRNVLTRAVGVADPPLGLEMVRDRLEPEDLLLLCSDGLYGVVDEAELETVLGSVPLAGLGDALVARCIAGGAPDNITLVAVSATEATLVQFGSGDHAGVAQ